MGTRKQQSIRFRARSVSDTVDGENSPPGAMAALSNLIQDPSTPACFICRPANTKLIDFTAWGAAPGTVGVIVDAYQVSNIIYGLVGITSGTFAGKDYPFAYNVTTGAFLAIAAVTVAKCPTSQATAGAWTPPQMTLTGILLVSVHIGFPGGGGAFFGWFNLTVPTAPTWNVGNTTTNVLPSVPQGVGTFNNRTYFLCGNLAYYTDTLALSMFAANQSISVGDYTPVTCVAPLPVGTSSVGIIQGLILFKLNATYLLTGDATANVSGIGQPLGLNELSSSVGTGAPRSAVSTPGGVHFMAGDGVRIINFFGFLSEPNEDLAIPFINAVTPSRVAAAFNSDTYRICLQNGIVAGSPYQDYWYNFLRKSWTGPHTFRYDLAISLGNDFVLASNSLIASMWDSYVVQGHAGEGVTFIENGTQLTWVWETSPMTDLDNIYANSVLRTTIRLGAPAGGQTYNFIAQNESGTALASAQITEPVGEAVWGQFNWGQANWGAGQAGLMPVTIPWNQAVVFNELSILATGNSALGLKIGNLQIGYKRLNYLLN